MLCIGMSVNDWRCQSWKEKFVICFKVIVNDYQYQSWNDNFVLCLRWLSMIGSAGRGKTILCCVLS